jgi:YesN/AraC family two-component response regulator
MLKVEGSCNHWTRLRGPNMRVLFTSGYTDGSIARHGLLEATMSFLAKPLTVASLTAKVREVLDAPPPEPIRDA